MLIPEKKDFMNEVAKITNEETRMELETLYNHLKGYKRIMGSKKLVKKVIADLFPSKFTKDIFIPLAFHESIIGRVIFSVFYGTEDNTYTIQEFIEFTKTPKRPNGYTKQHIGYEIKEGNLKALKKNNRWVFTEEDIEEYLSKKGLKE